MKNSGIKIQNLATGFCMLGIASSVVCGLILSTVSITTNEADKFLISIILLIAGPLVSWISCLLLYAFGELVDNSSAIRSLLEEEKEKSVNNINNNSNNSNNNITNNNINNNNNHNSAPVVSKELSFTCPQCNRKVQPGSPACECGQRFDWSKR